MAFTLEDMQKVKLTAKGQSAAGNPTTDLAGPLTWVSSDPSIVSLEPQAVPDCYAIAEGPIGSARVSVSGQNSKGETITGFLDIDVKAGPTAAIMVTAGTPEIK